MAKFIAEIKCPHRFCRGSFKIEVDERYSNKRMKMNCPKCLGDFIGRIPEAPKVASSDSDKDLGIIQDILRTGEEFVTGAHAAVTDVLGKLRRDVGAD